MTTLTNHVQLFGRLGQDTELQPSTDGSPQARTTLFTERTWRDARGDTVSHVQWHRLVGTDGIARHMKAQLYKDQQVLVRGALVYRQEARGGAPRHIAEILVRSFMLVSPDGVEK